MRLIILFLMFVFSILSCSLKKKSSVEVVEHKTETLKEEQKSEVQSVLNASTFVDSSKTLAYNDAVREVVETYKYTPPDSTGAIYIKEYARIERDKQSNAKQIANTRAQSVMQDSVIVNYESARNSYIETHTKTKTKEQGKYNSPMAYNLVAIVLIAVFVIMFWIFRERVWKFFVGLY